MMENVIVGVLSSLIASLIGWSFINLWNLRNRKINLMQNQVYDWLNNVKNLNNYLIPFIDQNRVGYLSFALAQETIDLEDRKICAILKVNLRAIQHLTLISEKSKSELAKNYDDYTKIVEEFLQFFGWGSQEFGVWEEKYIQVQEEFGNTVTEIINKESKISWLELRNKNHA